jgi:hypothetical protein
MLRLEQLSWLGCRRIYTCDLYPCIYGCKQQRQSPLNEIDFCVLMQGSTWPPFAPSNAWAAAAAVSKHVAEPSARQAGM